MNEDNELLIQFSFDNLEILTMTDKDKVALKCILEYYAKDNSDYCIVYITKELFHQILDCWLENKQNYYISTNGGFAGVGFISFTDVKERKDSQKSYLIIFNDDENYEKVYVRTFDAFAFDIDMEHG